MQLDSNVKTLLDTLANSGQPKLWDLTPPDARQMVRLFSEMLEGKETIGAIEHRSLPGPAGPVASRLYVPVGAGDPPTAGIVFFMAALGFSVISTHMTAFAALSPMKAVVASYRSITVLRPSISFPRLLTMHMPRPNGLRLMRSN